MKPLFLTFLTALILLLTMNSCGGDGICTGDCFDVTKPQTQAGGGPGFYHTAFVTSVRLSGNSGGLAGADALCEQLAKRSEATKNMGGTWKSILSDSQMEAKNRIVLQPGAAIKTTSYAIVVEAAEDLWKGKLQSPIQFDENGTQVISKVEVWSGSLSDGTRVSGPSLVTNCTDWNDGTTIDNGGNVGNLEATDQKWLQGDDWIGCAKTDEKARLYCINSL